MLLTKKPKIFLPKFEVVGCFCEYKGKILLLKRQNNKPQGNTWGLPGGKINLNESVLEAIKRELKEETGIQIDNNKINLFKTTYVKYDDLDFVYYIFHTLLGYNPEIKIIKKEHSKYIWITPQEALTINLIEDLDKCISLKFCIETKKPKKRL